MKRKRASRTALVVSILLIFVWLLLGTSSSVAWFKAEDELINSLYFGDLSVGLYYKTPTGYVTVDQATEIFSDEALFEPGYTQIVYFRINNEGTVPFTYELSLVPDLASMVYASSVLGNRIDLSDYIKFGLVLGDTEEAVMEQTKDRDIARSVATERMSNYFGETGTLGIGETSYAALIVYMPEDVENDANYRGDTAPSMTFGISARATQLS